MTKPQLRVLIIEQQYVVRVGLCVILAEQNDLAIVNDVQSIAEALTILRSSSYDLILIDWKACRDVGLTAIRKLRLVGRGAKVLVYSDRDGDGDILKAIDAGASGYLLKSASREEIVQTIRHVVCRERYLPPNIAQCLAEKIGTQQLTGRELEVLSLVREGWRNRQIAQKLAVAETTINFHVKNVLSKLTANDRTHAVMIAMRRGLLPLCPTPDPTLRADRRLTSRLLSSSLNDMVTS